MGPQGKLKTIVVLCIFLLISGCASTPATQTEINTLQTESVDSESEKKQFFVWGPSFYSSIVDIQVYASDEFIAGGTGTIITEDGLIITNQHVVVGGDEFEIYTYGTYDAESGEFVNPETNEIVEPLPATLMGSSQCNDIAVLQIDSNRVFNYLEWYGEEIMPGLEIYTLGYPGVAAGEIAVTTGVVSYINSLGDTTWTAPGYNTFAHTSPIFSGNSGGPVVTAEGKLVGINYLTEESYDEAFPISKAINNNYVKDIVDNYLSKAGFKVTLVDKNDKAGGRLSQFRSNGFTFDKGPSWYWMTDVFDDFFNDRAVARPYMNNVQRGAQVYNNDDDWQVVFAVPGVKKDDVKIKIDDHVLTVSYESNKEDGRFNFVSCCRKY